MATASTDAASCSSSMLVVIPRSGSVAYSAAMTTAEPPARNRWRKRMRMRQPRKSLEGNLTFTAPNTSTAQTRPTAIRRRPRPSARSTTPLQGQGGLIGWFAKSAVPPRKPGRGGPILTNNARIETIAEKPTFRDPWKRGQRCIIPAWSYVEPNWETGRNQWWRFRRQDGEPWGMAGLWNARVDPATGEVDESYTMVTQNADCRPLLSRMHRPDPGRPATMQDKRAVIALAPSCFEVWLRGTVDEATSALHLPHFDVYAAGPDAPPRSSGAAQPPHEPEQERLV